MKPIIVKHVELDGRKFTVGFFDLEMEQPSSVKERVLHEPGRPWQCYADKPRWHHSRPLGGSKTLPRRVIAAAKGETL